MNGAEERVRVIVNAEEIHHFHIGIFSGESYRLSQPICRQRALPWRSDMELRNVSVGDKIRY